MRHKSLSIVLMFVAVILGAFALFKTSNNGSTSTTTTGGNQSSSTSQGEYNSAVQPSASSPAQNNQSATANARTFAVSGTEFKFSPNTITVNKGDKVTINFTNNGTTQHNWTLSGYDVRTATVPPGQTASVTFTADRTGTFQYYCSVDSHKEQGMVGTLVVR